MVLEMKREFESNHPSHAKLRAESPQDTVRSHALPPLAHHRPVSTPGKSRVQPASAPTLLSLELAHEGSATTITTNQPQSLVSKTWKAASLSANHHFYPTQHSYEYEPASRQDTMHAVSTVDPYPSLTQNHPSSHAAPLPHSWTRRMPLSAQDTFHLAPHANCSPADSPLLNSNSKPNSPYSLLDNLSSPNSPLPGHYHLLQKHFKPRELPNIQILHQSPLADDSLSPKSQLDSPGTPSQSHTIPSSPGYLSPSFTRASPSSAHSKNQSRVPVTPSHNLHTNPIVQQHISKYNYAVTFHNEFKTPKTPDTFKHHSLFHNVIQFSSGDESEMTTEHKIFSIKNLNQNIMKSENILKKKGPSSSHISGHSPRNAQQKASSNHKTPKTPNFIRKIAQKNYHLQHVEWSVLPVEIVEHIFKFCDLLSENTPYKELFDRYVHEAHTQLFPSTVNTVLPTMKSQHQQRHKLWFLYWRKFSSKIFKNIFHLFYARKGEKVFRLVWYFNAERDLQGIRRRNYDVTKGTDVEYHWYTLPVAGMCSVALPKANILEFAEWIMEETHKHRMWKSGASPLRPWSLGMQEIAVDLCVGIGNDSGIVLRGWDKVHSVLRNGKRAKRKLRQQSRETVLSRSNLMRTPPPPVMEVAKKITAVRQRYMELTSPPVKAFRSTMKLLPKKSTAHRMRRTKPTSQQKALVDDFDASLNDPQYDPDNEYGPVYLPPSLTHTQGLNALDDSGKLSLSPRYDDGDTSPLSAWKKTATPREEEESAAVTAAKVPPSLASHSRSQLNRLHTLDDEEHASLRDSLRMTKSLLMDSELWKKKKEEQVRPQYFDMGVKKHKNEPEIGVSLTPPPHASQGNSTTYDLNLSPIMPQSQLVNTPRRFTSPNVKRFFPAPSNGSSLGLHHSPLNKTMELSPHSPGNLTIDKKKMLTPLRINTSGNLLKDSPFRQPVGLSPTDLHFDMLPPTPMNSRASSRAETPLADSHRNTGRQDYENDPQVKAALRYYLRDSSYIPSHSNKTDITEDKIVSSIRFWGFTDSDWMFRRISSLSVDEELNGAKAVQDLVCQCTSLRTLSLTRVKNGSRKLLSTLAMHSKLRKVHLHLCSNDVAAAILQNYNVTYLSLGFVNLHLGNMVHTPSAFDKKLLGAIGDNVSITHLNVCDRSSNNRLLGSLFSYTNAKYVSVSQSRGCCPDFSNVSLSVETLYLAFGYTQRFSTVCSEWSNMAYSQVQTLVLINIFGYDNGELLSELCKSLRQCETLEHLYFRDAFRNDDVAPLLEINNLKKAILKSPRLDINLCHFVRQINNTVEEIRVAGGSRLDWLLFDSVKQMFPNAKQCDDVCEDHLSEVKNRF
mmetsp:Transcript_2484/g.9346  ORF Transcript_2484/g.9346 Transcript_2484/m.9346 type:complete len:1342 (-) Transcript_2484:251-4276(-)|eukprot:CAMPEP_0117447232 /NCGR_PEP_ID=MMETSP0759-20121206/6764_1 /TAXON_ID=63605 /ORGANISM="Percolomonas cosmopolitus, Strain WS" /LENGTH=1341 /DNA_ID=CAMNT_0005239551 /DNA_START=1226 /DNA_END=5251 /DNA_ORIENTATION=-